MNKQAKFKNGVLVGRGIEWTDYTWNPIAGCFHACQWSMPDGSIANCYAEDVADRVAQKAYPNGFEFDYWHPEILREPISQKTPSKIFVGSMADVFGHCVEKDRILQVLEICDKAPQHTFQFLTKNPKRVWDFVGVIPENCWIGASTPPDFMWNKPLKQAQKERLFETTLNTLSGLKSTGITTWISAEPLSHDWSRLLSMFVQSDREDYSKSVLGIDWIVIGAASNGKAYYPPLEQDVRRMMMVCEQWSVPMFFKGNLKSLKWAAENWREEFPVAKSVEQSLF